MVTRLATAYAYDESGIFLGETDVQEIEGRPGVYNMIPNCTLEPPPETDDQHYPRWTGEKWVVERVLSQVERYKAGIDQIPDGMVVEGDAIRPMNQTELVAAGKLTQADADRMGLQDEERALQAYLLDTAWYVDRDGDYRSSGGRYGKPTPEDVLAKRQEARDRISEIRGLLV